MIRAALPPRLSAEDVTEMLEEHRRTGDGRGVGRCPAHGDRGPSLSVNTGEDGRVLLHCFAGCTFSEIVAALGIQPGQLFPPSGDWKPPRSPRPDPDRAARRWMERLRNLHRPPEPERYRRELRFVGAVLVGGTAAFGRVPDFKAETLKAWGLRVLWQAIQAIAQEQIPRRRFSLAALAREVDFAAGRPGYFRERGLYRLGRLAVGIALHHPQTAGVSHAA